MEQLAKELDKAIREKRVTMAALVESTGLSRMQIYRLRRGVNRPSLDNAEAIAKAIGLRLTFQKVK